MNKKIILITITLLISILFFSACIQEDQPISDDDPHDDIIGGDKDEHGCFIAAGMDWCPSAERCMQMWDEYCPEFADRFDDSEINSFEECANVGFPVMESHPRQCRTNSGKHFVEEI